MTGTYAEAVQRGGIGRSIATAMSVAAAVAVIGTFLPWLRSGTRQRDSYDVFAIVERLGYSSSGAAGWAIRLWPAFPVLSVATLTLAWTGRPRSAAAVGAATGAYGLAVAATVLAASPAGVVSVRFGPWITLAGAADLLVAAVLLVVVSRSGSADSG